MLDTALNFLVVFCIVAVFILVYHMVRDSREDEYGRFLREMDQRSRERAALSPQRQPLIWDREKGFNRAPTLAEAERFTPDADGDLEREAFSEKNH